MRDRKSYFIVGLLGGLLGIGSVFFLLRSPAGLAIGSTEPVVINNWRSDWAYGTTQSNPYTRAFVAKYGLFALPREQSVYFIRHVDDDGAALTDSCSYVVTLPPHFPSNWWSITLYETSGYLPRNDGNAMAVDQRDLAGGTDQILVAAQKPADYEGLFISSSKAGAFDLTLRLYEPSAALIKDPRATLATPTIAKSACGGDL